MEITMERLIKKVSTPMETYYKPTKAKQEVFGNPGDQTAFEEAFRRLYEYEQAEEQGLLIKLPCKAGDVVHKIRKCLAPGCKTCGGYKRVDNCYCEYKARIFETSFIYSYIDDYGKTVFLTREEAESALKGGSL